MNKKVLVTGCNGFTGRWLVPLLHERGFDVVGLERGSAAPLAAAAPAAPVTSSAGEIRRVLCDLNDAARLREVVAGIAPTHVLHLAAISFVGHAGEEDFYRVNLFGTQNLLDVLEALPVPPEKVILASTANIYGTPADGRAVLDESAPPAPVNHYAISKLAMEFMARTRFARLPILITRPFNYTGPGQAEHFVIPKIVAHFRRRAPRIELGNINVSRDFSDVRDVARCYAALLETGDTTGDTVGGDAAAGGGAAGGAPRPRIVNICSGTGTALRDIIARLEHLAGYRIEVAVNPRFVRANEIPSLVGSNAALRAATGGVVPQIPIGQTLADMLAQG
ncbi:MAG: GDP-mannose 4,6-dehydratase [Puniceicoccales bacterium]|jgi:nucleoside-diphosphate-sugar epimerase|nr:GDP-mannose 4,6-dehydratase [Puniceicoccales bacterium]